MKINIKQIVTFYILCACTTSSFSVPAETSTTSGVSGSEISTTARLKLRVIIPRFLQFQLGSTGPTVDTIAFEPTPDAVGNAVAVAGTGGSAIGGSGTSVELRSNAGQITIVADNDGGAGGLGNSGTISLSEITARSDSSDLQTPQLTDAGMTTTKATLTDGDITEQRATWSYEYSNSRTVEPGTYGADIIYTAVSP
ncbi:MAG: hypothetical protein DRQ45_06785 [Gammaproteobacteria bacterium]|nr:MAG: hypothetical protein DRQ45_06785 [Gammaproteobacteria bacterium]